MKSLLPEGIPLLGTFFYNLISGSNIFQRHYDLIARDIVTHCPEGNLLDIGTGPGWLLLKLHKQSSKLRLTGLDVSPSMVKQAAENMAHAGLSHVIEMKVGNVTRLPYPDASFHWVVSTGSIHHWKDPTTAFNEIHRVLKQGGQALIYDIVSDTPWNVLRQMGMEFGKIKMVFLWLHAFEEPFYSLKNFEMLSQSTPFKNEPLRFVGVLCCLTLRKTPFTNTLRQG